MKQERINEIRRGGLVFAVLALLTALEYLLGTNAVPPALLWLIALSKAGLVAWFFMHIFRVFRSEGGH